MMAKGKREMPCEVNRGPRSAIAHMPLRSRDLGKDDECLRRDSGVKGKPGVTDAAASLGGTWGRDTKATLAWEEVNKNRVCLSSEAWRMHVVRCGTIVMLKCGS